MVKQSKTNNPITATQQLYELIPKLENLLDTLENTDIESKDMIAFAYDTHSDTLFNNYVSHIQFHLKRIYHKNKKDGKSN